MGAGLVARVLEPSPPAIDDGEWFADDPVAADTADGAAVLRPVGPGTTWADWVRDHPEHRSWASERWLADHRRLDPVPASWVDTRLALHRLAVYVISPARRRVNTKMGLRWTRGGFGTPFFPGPDGDEQIRVEGTNGVRQRGEKVDAVPITTLSAAAAFVLDGPPDIEWAAPFDVPAVGDVDDVLPVDPAAARLLGDFFGFAYSTLEELRADARTTDTSRVQLWPEHFDAAFDGLPEPHRVTLGASPGDSDEPAPYLYASPWDKARATGDLWNATSFTGAILRYDELVDAPDQRAAAMAFFTRCRDAVLG